MSEITDDYISDPNYHVYGPIDAKAAKLAGSGSINGYMWELSEDVLPDALIDSDESTSEASGAPTLRISTDQGGASQIGIHVIDFTPASGGAGGGATARILYDSGNYIGGSSKSIYLHWITGGSQTQPAASATYGSESVYESNVKLALLNDISGGSIADSTSNANSAAVTNAVSTSSAKLGTHAVEFDGSGDYLVVSDDNSLDMDTAVTALFWANPDNISSGGSRTLLSKRVGNPTNYGISMNTSTNVLNFFFYDGSFQVHTISLSTYLPISTWTHVGGVWVESGSDVIVRAYINGSKISETTFSSKSLLTNANDLTIGSFHFSGATYLEPYDGKMDSIYVVSEALSDDQISTLYQNQNNVSDFYDTTSAVLDPAPPAASELAVFIPSSFVGADIIGL